MLTSRRAVEVTLEPRLTGLMHRAVDRIPIRCTGTMIDAELEHKCDIERSDAIAGAGTGQTVGSFLSRYTHKEEGMPLCNNCYKLSHVI